MKGENNSFGYLIPQHFPRAEELEQGHKGCTVVPSTAKKYQLSKKMSTLTTKQTIKPCKKNTKRNKIK